MNMVNDYRVDSEVVYTADEIMKMLKLSKAKTYQFLDEAYRTSSPFKVIKIGKSVRVPKRGFDAWLQTFM